MTTFTEIKGHPSVQAQREDAPALEITLCAGCESVKSILFLTGDRWYCTKCRTSGNARPTRVAVPNPKKGKVR